MLDRACMRLRGCPDVARHPGAGRRRFTTAKLVIQ